MKRLIIANWKMNPDTEKEAKELFNSIKEEVKNVKNIEVVICPPFVFLPILRGLTLGAQNVFYKEKGAYTGEVSPLQLRDLGVEYVVIGHSEARKYLNETDEIINKKIKECLHEKLKPIFCIGEKEGENKNEILEKQITGGLKNVSEKELDNMVIAYEPVWAIGTGENCSVEETKASISLIRKIINDLCGKGISDSIRIIYGGSVNSKNSSEYLKNTGVDGLLVGRDSLNTEDFVKIVKSAQ